MKLLPILFIFVTAGLVSTGKTVGGKSPLSKYSKEWDLPRYNICNTAEHVAYLSEREKEIIYVLNLARMNPKLFNRTVFKKANPIPTTTNRESLFYYESLDSTLSVLNPLPPLQPDSLCILSALYHAKGSGEKSYCGHTRQTPESKKATYLSSECAYAGSSNPLVVVLTFLLDEDVPSLGHRNICLGNYKKISVGIAQDKSFGYAVILDFY
jgi:hypothetical protein